MGDWMTQAQFNRYGNPVWQRRQRIGNFTVESLMSGIASGLGSAILDQYDTVTILTEATPPLSVNLRDATASGPPSPVAQWLKPTIVLTGKAGQKVIAPYGVSAGSHGGPILLVLGLLGLGFVVGRLT